MTRSDHDEDRRFLAVAIELSRRQATAGLGGPFGAVVVRDGLILAEGGNEVTASHDPTAHAEIVAIRRACRGIGNFSLAGATIYASCEPCPMCLAAIYWARLDRLVFANTRAEAAAIGFDDALIYDEIPKPFDQRLLPTQRLALPEAHEPFRIWQTSATKVPY